MPFSTGFEGLTTTRWRRSSAINRARSSWSSERENGGGNAIKEWVTRDPTIGNGWIFDQDPITVVGSHNCSHYSVGGLLDRAGTRQHR